MSLFSNLTALATDNWTPPIYSSQPITPLPTSMPSTSYVPLLLLHDIHHPPPSDEERNRVRHLLDSPETAPSGESTKKLSRRRRRNLNVPLNSHDRYAQLHSTSSKRIIQVDPNGRINTTKKNIHPALSIFEVILWCSIQSSPLYPCSEANSSTTLGVILLHFTESKRFICMNSIGHLYTKSSWKSRNLRNLEECSFHHEIAYGNHDIYYSWNYPSSESRPSRRTTPVGGGTRSRRLNHTLSHHNSAIKANGTTRPRWYISVSKSGKIKTARTRYPRKSILFMQRWIHRPGNAGQVQEDFQNPHGNGRGEAHNRTNRHSSQPAFPRIFPRREHSQMQAKDSTKDEIGDVSRHDVIRSDVSHGDVSRNADTVNCSNLLRSVCVNKRSTSRPKNKSRTTRPPSRRR